MYWIIAVLVVALVVFYVWKSGETKPKVDPRLEKFLTKRFNPPVKVQSFVVVA